MKDNVQKDQKVSFSADSIPRLNSFLYRVSAVLDIVYRVDPKNIKKENPGDNTAFDIIVNVDSYTISKEIAIEGNEKVSDKQTTLVVPPPNKNIDIGNHTYYQGT